IGQLTVIPPSSIEDIEFSSGGFGAEYGDATGGVVVVRTKKEIPERPLTKFTLNLPIYSGIYHERPLSENSGMSVGIRRSYIDLILPKVLPKDSGVTLVPFIRDYQGAWMHKTDVGFQKLTLLASSDGLRATVPSGFSNDENGSAQFFVKTYYGVIAFEQSTKLNADWSYSSTPQVVYTDSQFNVNDLRFQVKAYNMRLPLEFSKRISSTEKLYTGVDISYVPYTVTYYLPRFDRNDPFYDVEEAPREAADQTGKFYRASSWLTRDFQLGPWLLTPGLRAFYMTQNHRAGADPRFSGRFGFMKDQAIKFAVGQYSQFPKNGEAAPDFGNPKIKFTHAMHYILGIESKWDDRWETDFQLFHKDVKDVIRSDAVTNYNNKGALRSRGAELFLRRAMSEKWFGWVSYTWSKAEERKSSEDPWYPGENDQTHVLNVAGNYRWTANWESGGRLASHTGDTYTSKIGPAVYNTNLDKYQPRGDLDSVNSARLPHYNELSLYSSHDFLYDTSKLTFRWGLEYLWFKR
ncbi:MAG: hypothetical protein NTV34_11900, partial [Proteobacteria bacterium]|nr:hypothetical protein [Pseudomonadota bacterium]